jgi:hypothetical protein
MGGTFDILEQLALHTLRNARRYKLWKYTRRSQLKQVEVHFPISNNAKATRGGI